MYADHSLRLAQEIVTENFFLCLLRQEGKGGGKFRMVQNGGLAAGGKKIFFKLFRLGKLDKLLIHQIVKSGRYGRTDEGADHICHCPPSVHGQELRLYHGYGTGTDHRAWYT